MSMARVCASRTCRNRFTPEGNRRKYCSLVCSKRENQRKYAEAHPEKVREAMRQWESVNRDKRRAYNREKTRDWRAANIEKERKRGRINARKWRKEHHEQFIATQRKYRAESRAILVEKRRAREGSMPRAEYLKRMRKPRKPGKPKGQVAQDTPLKITQIAYCFAEGLTQYKIATYWERITGTKAAKTTIYSFIENHGTAIKTELASLSALSKSERDAAARLTDAQIRSVVEMGNKKILR